MYSQSHSTNKVFLFFYQKVLFVLNSVQNLNNKKKTVWRSRVLQILQAGQQRFDFFLIFKTFFCFSHVQNLKKEETSTTIEWPKIQI